MIKLYPYTHPKTGQSFKGDKVWTVPSQSLSLAEIIKRFIRRQPLPTTNDGIYETRFGDIEKMALKDPVEQLEYAADLESKIKAFEKRQSPKPQTADSDPQAVGTAAASAKGDGAAG